MGALIYAGQPLVAGTGPGELNQYYHFADANVTTVTADTLANLSSVYTIPAGEAYADAEYEILASGNGEWGSTQQQLTLQVALAGNALGAGVQIGKDLFNTSQNFRWSATGRLICVTTGTSATWIYAMDMIISVYNGTILPGTPANNSASGTDSITAAATQDSTVANTVAIQAVWGSATGAPTITCRKTRWSKVA